MAECYARTDVPKSDDRMLRPVRVITVKPPIHPYDCEMG